MAEILITITIIGIVAILTLPTLNKALKQHQVSVALPKMYSNLNNAAKMYQTEYGIDIGNFDTSISPQDFLNTYFKPYFKGAVICNSTEDCWKNAKPPYNIDKKTKISIDSGLIMNTGEILGIAQRPAGMVFFYDIDGAKGDNLSGHDIFNFYLINLETQSVCEKDNPSTCAGFKKCSAGVKSGLYLGGAAGYWIPFIGFSTQELLETSTRKCGLPMYRLCNRKTGHIYSTTGDACAAVLYQNNWKFPKNYPW